ncbi:hypothetical protein OG689_10785 [Kitasatospora sp. NBC_00240]|uniref:hypothetical protein n=1 Tax=Kitasatospora sp. NBC_00240 TaxID=2903567 RepID=UPI0022557A68|nr:hypothetical protein [Kitasatospora sp. NBC_00240]MCX5209769.1 hypothetical protein [Kitasatospora sp. NBC_00240]
MIRSPKFLISQKPFALDLATITAEQSPQGDRWYLSGHADAVWFRRKDGTTRACIGTLGLWRHHMTDQVDVTDVQAILAADLDSRYGGDCYGRWDGERYWGAQEPEVMARHLAVLRPMLDAYPTIPAGYDGWWRF